MRAGSPAGNQLEQVMTDMELERPVAIDFVRSLDGWSLRHFCQIAMASVSFGERFR